MKNTTLNGVVCAIAFAALTACANEPSANNGNNVINPKQNTLRNLVFNAEFDDYSNHGDGPQKMFAGTSSVQSDTINLSNGMRAIATLTPDKFSETASKMTRTLPNDTYTMEAFNGYTHEFQGKLTGKVENGKFISLDGKEDIILEHDYYHFLLYNSKLYRQDGVLMINRANADDAFVGYVSEIIKHEPRRQVVLFPMKRKGVRLKMKITGTEAFGPMTATLSNANSEGLPASLKYELRNNSWSTATKSAFSQPITFGRSVQKAGNNTHFALANEFTYLLFTTNAADLKMKFNSGTIYGEDITGAELQFKNLVFDVNGSYVLAIELTK